MYVYVYIYISRFAEDFPLCIYTYLCMCIYICTRIHVICTYLYEYIYVHIWYVCIFFLPASFPRSPSVYVYTYIYVSMYNICLSNTCAAYLSFECFFSKCKQIYTYIHCITLHYITLHYTTLQFDLLHCIASHHKHAYPPTYIQTDTIHSSIFRINIFGNQEPGLILPRICLSLFDCQAWNDLYEARICGHLLKF